MINIYNIPDGPLGIIKYYLVLLDQESDDLFSLYRNIHKRKNPSERSIAIAHIAKEILKKDRKNELIDILKSVLRNNETNDRERNLIIDSFRNNIRFLNFSYKYKNLTILPDWIGNLTGLKTLHFRDNQLAELPDSIGRLTELKTLDLGFNHLDKLPDSIGRLTGLKYLELFSNHLTTLPDLIGNLTGLKWMDFSHNKLVKLSDSIGNLTRLEGLIISNNRLTTLPDSIGNLTRLEELNLRDNHLTILPDSLSQLKLCKIFIVPQHHRKRSHHRNMGARYCCY